MMRLLVLAMLFSATSALADAPPPPQTVPPLRASQPLSVWRPVGGGDLQHLQSGLACPATFVGYRRTQIDLYDHAGLDVSCNYAADRRDLTVYLTRRSGSSVADALAEAKRELFQVRAAMQPTPISESRSKAGGLDWAIALYSLNNGLHTGIWIADLDGWTVEYRASYQVGVENQVLADISALTTLVQKSAGVRLELCARSPSPSRFGAAVTDPKTLSHAALMTGLMGGGAMAAAAEGKPVETPTPVTWCVEQAIPNGAGTLLYWRGVHDDGSDARTDRLTPMIEEAPPALVVAPDELANLVAHTQAHAEYWVATIAGADQTRVFGYFTDRPSPELLTSLFKDIASDKAKPLAGYSARGKAVTISIPSAQ